jgi:hypothetical protein
LDSFGKNRRRRFSQLLFWWPSKAHAWTATVFVDELDLATPGSGFGSAISSPSEATMGLALFVAFISEDTTRERLIKEVAFFAAGT